MGMSLDVMIGYGFWLGGDNGAYEENEKIEEMIFDDNLDLVDDLKCFDLHNSGVCNGYTEWYLFVPDSMKWDLSHTFSFDLEQLEVDEDKKAAFLKKIEEMFGIKPELKWHAISSYG